MNIAARPTGPILGRGLSRNQELEIRAGLVE
jgi:hypothetical protein